MKLRGDQVAVILADYRMPGLNGIEFLERAMDVYPYARRVLLTAYADTNAAIDAINLVDVDHYLLKPWDPPEEKLYPVIDDLLRAWRKEDRKPVKEAKLVGHRWSAPSADLRDFLARNQVPYRWFASDTDEGRRLLEAAGTDDRDIPVLITADGEPLIKPSHAEVAAKVGLATIPEREFYDLVVVGGGPAGIAAALAGARNGLSVTLLERYPYLGGLASGGMVLVLDDMCNGQEIAVRGLCADLIARLERLGLAVTPPEADRRSDSAMWRKWSRWGVFDFTSHLKPQPIVYAAAFDPDGFKRVSNDMIAEAKINLRLHSWFSRALVEDGAIKGVICESKEGRQAILGKIVVDATGDLDVAASAGAPFIEGAYIVTTVFRLGGVAIEEAERFEYEEPEAFKALDREAKRTIGGSWDKWWLKTPLPGVVWCNCPHMANYDGLKVDDLTRADLEGRKRIANLLEFLHTKMPGFRDCYVVDVAPQLGIRQTRLLEGLYVVTKEDVTERRHFADSVARGRDYYTPYRSLLPRDVKGLVVAGRHYSATSSAQRMSREIPPCMAMGEAAGEAAALALEGGVALDRVDVGKLQARLRARGADPGDRPAANATVLRAAE
jgi:CheY-like chemotaxis protein